MNISFTELKKIIYYMLTLLGLIFVVIAIRYLGSATFYSTINWITAVILLPVGLGLLVFGYETYMLRDDPDIWR